MMQKQIKSGEDNSKIILGLLIVVGFLLRLKAALNLEVLADDMLYASQSAGIIKAGILSTHSNPPLFFYLTDLAYTLFGYSTFASRFWPLVAGTLLIPLVFLLTRMLSKNEKVAIGAAFFVTFSTFLIRMTFTEHTLLVLFFVVFACLCGLSYLKYHNLKWLCLFAISFGLATLTKYSAPFFFISFCIFLGYLYEQKISFPQKHSLIKQIIIVLGIILLISLPFLAFNYFIYKEKGIVDVYFSRIIHIEKTQELYQGLAGQGESFFNRLAKLSSYSQYKLPLITDPLPTLFSLIGLTLLFLRKDKNTLPFVLIMIIIPFILQSGGSGLQKHFAFLHLFLAIPAGFAFVSIKERINSKSLRNLFYVILILGMLISLGTAYGTPENFRKQSATSELKNYVNDKVGANDLIILDSRIYSARSFWLATPNSFIFSSQFPEVYQSIVNLSAQHLKPTNVFFVECAIDDCGWGWVQNDQNLNKSSEELVSLFSQNGILVKSISAPEYSKQEFLKKSSEKEIYKVYFLTLNLPPEIIEESKNIQSFYFTPYLYKNMANYIFDYKVEGAGKLLEKLSHWIIYMAIIFTLIILCFVCWLLIRLQNSHYF